MSIPDWNSLGFSGVPCMDIYGWFKLNQYRMLHWIFSRSLPMFTPFSECLAYPKFFPMRYVRLSPSSNVGKRSSLWRADRMTSDVKQMEKNSEPRWTNKKLKQREYIYMYVTHTYLKMYISIVMYIYIMWVCCKKKCRHKFMHNRPNSVCVSVFQRIWK